MPWTSRTLQARLRAPTPISEGFECTVSAEQIHCCAKNSAVNVRTQTSPLLRSYTHNTIQLHYVFQALRFCVNE